MATWNIVQMERLIDSGFVFKAFWKCSLVDGFFAVSESGVCSLSKGDSFIPFDDLTEETVLSWVWEQVNKEETEAKLTLQLEAQKNPVSETGMPWANNGE